MESQLWWAWLRFFVLTFHYLCTNQTKPTMKRFAITFVLFFSMAYLIGSFLAASFDCSTWSKEQKSVIVILVIFTSVLTTLVLEPNQTNNGTKY